MYNKNYYLSKGFMIYIYSGLMSSGKTENLIKDYFKIKEDKKNKVLLVKSNNDRTEKFVKSRSGLKALADLSLNNNEVSVIASYIDTYNYTHVFIDEVQMFDEDIKYLVQNYNRINFYLSGLERNRFKKRFGYLSIIKAFENVKKINEYEMFCQNCEIEIAQEVFGFINTKDEIVVGDSEYISVCNNCYDILEKENKNE
jgi:thymidine kinase